MSDELYFNGNKYISSKRAAEETGYTHDYIGQLTRADRVPGRLVGRTKFVDIEALKKHKHESEDHKRQDAYMRSTRFKAGRKVPLNVGAGNSDPDEEYTYAQSADKGYAAAHASGEQAARREGVSGEEKQEASRHEAEREERPEEALPRSVEYPATEQAVKGAVEHFGAPRVPEVSRTGEKQEHPGHIFENVWAASTAADESGEYSKPEEQSGPTKQHDTSFREDGSREEPQFAQETYDEGHTHLGRAEEGARARIFSGKQALAAALFLILLAGSVYGMTHVEQAKSAFSAAARPVSERGHSAYDRIAAASADLSSMLQEKSRGIQAEVLQAYNAKHFEYKLAYIGATMRYRILAFGEDVREAAARAARFVYNAPREIFPLVFAYRSALEDVSAHIAEKEVLYARFVHAAVFEGSDALEAAGDLFADTLVFEAAKGEEISVERLCVGAVCITETELYKLRHIIRNNVASTSESNREAAGP